MFAYLCLYPHLPPGAVPCVSCPHACRGFQDLNSGLALGLGEAIILEISRHYLLGFNLFSEIILRSEMISSIGFVCLFVMNSNEFFINMDFRKHIKINLVK